MGGLQFDAMNKIDGLHGNHINRLGIASRYKLLPNFLAGYGAARPGE
jgi:hypothetical protein